MTAPVLADALGPRGRRLVRIWSVVAAVVLIALMVVAVRRLDTTGQLDWKRWEPLTRWSVVKFLGEGLVATMKAALLAMVFATVAGMGLALLLLARSAPVRWVAIVILEFFRGVPLLLLIFFTFFALPKYGINLNPFRALVLALGLYNAVVLGDIFKAGILSLDRGQTEAAEAIGLTYWQAMRLVILPQGIRRMIPAAVSQLVTLLKDTSLGFTITYEELLRRSRSTGEFFKNPLQTTVFVAVVYILVNLALSQVARRLEIRQRRRFGAGRIAVVGAEDLSTLALAAEVQIKSTGD
jgi:glutamate transport system permease protein